jgi:hypothetical protein
MLKLMPSLITSVKKTLVLVWYLCPPTMGIIWSRQPLADFSLTSRFSLPMPVVLESRGIGWNVVPE